MRIRTILGLLLFSLIFCTCKNESKDYLYYDGFSSYLAETYNINTEKSSEIFFVLPVNGCDSCIELNVELLSNNRYDIKLILVGETYDNKRLEKINTLVQNHENVILDKESIISQYRTGFSKPMIVSIEKGKCIYHLDVSDFKIEEARAYLKTKIID